MPQTPRPGQQAAAAQGVDHLRKVLRLLHAEGHVLAGRTAVPTQIDRHRPVAGFRRAPATPPWRGLDRFDGPVNNQTCRAFSLNLAAALRASHILSARLRCRPLIQTELSLNLVERNALRCLARSSSIAISLAFCRVRAISLSNSSTAVRRNSVPSSDRIKTSSSRACCKRALISAACAESLRFSQFVFLPTQE